MRSRSFRHRCRSQRLRVVWADVFYAAGGVARMFHRASFPELLMGCDRWLRGGLCLCLVACVAGCWEGGGDRETQGAQDSESQLEPPGTGSAAAATPAWDPEAFQDTAQAQLVAILGVLKAGGGDRLANFVVDPQHSVVGPLRPADSAGELVFDRDGIAVRRWKPQGGQEVARGGLGDAYAELGRSWPAGAEPRVAVKHFGVQPAADGGDTVTLTDFHAYVAGDRASVQQQAQWRCWWRPSALADAPPLLVAVELVELEEARSSHGGRGTALADVTLPLLGDLPAYRDSLRHDANYWATRLPRLKHRFQHGLAVGDVDGDGVEDIYLCQPEGLPNLLLMRQADGSVREAAAEFGLDFKDITTSAILADFDNDGDQDLALAFRSPFDLFENVGGRFERRFSLPHLGQIFSLAAADYDRDGLLDLYICRYQNFDELGRGRSPIPLHDATNGGANALLKNVGGWKFEDVTGRVGLGQNNDRWSMAASWEDYDRDGDLDLYVANDYGRNNFYRCDRDAEGGVHFQDIAGLVGVEDMTTSMGVSWGDPNRDGVADIYVSNMYSSAGRRVTSQGDFKRNIAGSDEAHVRAWQQASLGNSLFQGAADGSFSDAGRVAGIKKGLWSWGTVFADVNHDGWDDLLVANGFITGPSNEPDL